MFASDGMRPDLVDKYAAQGHAHDGGTHVERVGPERFAPGFRPIRASAGTRSRRERGRESTARRTTRSTAPVKATSTTDLTRGQHPAGRHAASGRGARRQENRLRRMGWRADTWSAGPGHRLPQLLLDPWRPDVPARSERAGWGVRGLLPDRRVRSGFGLDEHARGRRCGSPPQQAILADTTFARRIEPDSTSTSRQRRQRNLRVRPSFSPRSRRTPRRRRRTSRSATG